MPPKRKQASRQAHVCACGQQLFTSRAFSQHMQRCYIHQRNAATLRLHHSSVAPPPYRAAPQQDNEQELTMYEQQQRIQRRKADDEAFANQQQRQQHHKKMYETYLRQGMTLCARPKDATKRGSMPAEDNDDGNDMDTSSNTDDEDDNCGNANGNNDEEWSMNNDPLEGGDGFDDEDDDDDDEEEEEHEKEEEEDDKDDNDKEDGDAAKLAAPDECGPPPLFPIETGFDKQNSILFEGDVAPPTAAGIQLMDVIGKHSVDLKLYDDIVQFITNLANSGYNFQQHKIPKRSSLRQQCEETFNYSSLRPKMVDVPVATLPTPTVTMPVFNIRAVITKMLRNPRVMQESNFPDNYDIFTGKPIDSDECAFYDEVHTGKQWEIARDHYCDEAKNEMPIGLLLFYDKSVADRHGSLATSPIMFTLSIFNQIARSQIDFWDVLGYVPPLDAGTNKRSKESSTGLKITTRDKCQDEHICLAMALRQLKEVNDSGGITLTVLGKDVKVKVWIHCVIGDISGNNVLLGHYNTFNVQSPYRDCRCPSHSFTDPNAKCTLIRKEEIDRMKAEDNVEELKAASKHNITNAFDIIPTGNPSDSIYHLTPPETMHAINSGIVMRMIESIGDEFKQKDALELLHNVHLLLVQSHSLQSERHASSRPSVRNHVVETTKTQASEYMGNLFLLMCALHTEMGRTICTKAKVSDFQRKGKIETIKMVLALEKWLNRRNRKSDIDDVNKIDAYIRRQVIPNLQKYFPREEGAGWLFPKVHSLTKFPLYISLFGSARNFYGGTGESNLKSFMKQLAKYTQRRQSKFASQLAENHYTQQLFAHSSFCIREQTKTNYVQEDDPIQTKYSGSHTITFTRRTNLSRVEYTTNVTWQNKSSSQPLDDIVRYIISRYMSTENPDCRKFRVQAYTTATLPNNKENLASCDAGPSHSLYKVDTRVSRFDWCMILTHKLGSEKVDERFDIMGYTCPAQIHGFVRFESGGLPTPCLLQEKDAQTIRNLNIIDENMYVIVRTHKKFLSWKQLEKQFVVPIELGELDGYTYIFPVERIINPLYVFEDLGQPINTSNPKFFATLPARYSAFFLDHKLNPQLIPGEGGLSQKCDEENKD